MAGATDRILITVAAFFLLASRSHAGELPARGRALVLRRLGRPALAAYIGLHPMQRINFHDFYGSLWDLQMRMAFECPCCRLV